MISDLKTIEDDAGFPIVSWTESRNFFAPGGFGHSRVECRIMKKAHTGELLFVARGQKDNAPFAQSELWQGLTRFSLQPAASLYRSPTDDIPYGALAKTQLGQLFLTDKAKLFYAEFGPGVSPIHVNYADASKRQFDRLHLALTNAFCGREDYVASKCKTFYRWPIDDTRVPTYDASEGGWPDDKARTFTSKALEWATAIVVLSGTFAGLLWLIGILPDNPADWFKALR